MASKPPEPTQEQAEEATQRAQEMFFDEGLRKMATARLVNRFHIQKDGDAASIFVGSIGVMGKHRDGEESMTLIPYADVLEVYRVDATFLESMRKVIDELYPAKNPSDTEPENEDG